MKISELIVELEKAKKEHGDIPVVIVDADTGWYMAINDIHGIAENVLVVQHGYCSEDIKEDKALAI